MVLQDFRHELAFAIGAWQVRSCKADGLELLHLLDSRLPATDVDCPVSIAAMAALLDVGLRCTALPGSCRPSMAEVCATLQHYMDRLEALQIPSAASVVSIGTEGTPSCIMTSPGSLQVDYVQATGHQHVCEGLCSDCASSQKSVSSGSHCSLDPLNP